MGFIDDVNTIHGWILARPGAVYVVMLLLSAQALVLALALALEWRARVGPPVLWLMDAAIIVLFWGSHFRFRSQGRTGKKWSTGPSFFDSVAMPTPRASPEGRVPRPDNLTPTRAAAGVVGRGPDPIPFVKDPRIAQLERQLAGYARSVAELLGAPAT